MIAAIRRQLGRIWTRLFGGPAAREPAIAAEPTDWCLVGNVVEEHACGETKGLRRGSKHFAPGTKVYCLPPQWGDGYEKIVAVGIARRSRRLITVVMPSDQITNWRAKVVYKPAVMQRIRQIRRQWKSRDEVESFAHIMRERDRSATT
jgi:hypothetical protein